MKKIILVAFILLYKIESSAQYVVDSYPWCPQGATWIYKSFSATSTLYFKFTFEKDTLINTISSKKLNVERINYIGIQPGEGRTSAKVGQEFLSEQNDSIFWFDTISKNFKFIYSFNPVIGDKFIVSNSRATCFGSPSFPSSDTVVVTSTFIDTFSNRIFNVYNTTFNDNFQIGDIVSKIGSLKSPFPQINRNVCQSSHAEYGDFYEKLVCYQDNLRGSVHFSSETSSECHSISTSIKHIEKTDYVRYSLFPNPTNSNLQIEGGLFNPKSIAIYNSLGQIVKFQEINYSRLISVADLASGSYFVKIIDEKFNVSIYKLIKN